MIRSVGFLNTALIALAPLGGVKSNAPEVVTRFEDFSSYRGDEFEFAYGFVGSFNFQSSSSTSFYLPNVDGLIDIDGSIYVDVSEYDEVYGGFNLYFEPGQYILEVVGDFLVCLISRDFVLYANDYQSPCYFTYARTFDTYFSADVSLPSLDSDIFCFYVISYDYPYPQLSGLASYLLSETFGFASSSPSDGFFGTFTDALGGVVGTIGTGIGSAVGSLFVQDGKLSTFGYVMATFGGVSLALGLGACVFTLVTSLGGRKHD